MNLTINPNPVDPQTLSLETAQAAIATYFAATRIGFSPGSRPGGAAEPYFTPLRH